MSIAVASVILLGFVAVYIATAQPWLGLRLERNAVSGAISIAHVPANGPAAAIQPGQLLVSINGMALERDDLVEEPDTLRTYAIYERVLARQGMLRDQMLQPQVSLGVGPDGSDFKTIKPAPRRPLGALPLAFWSQLFAGASGFLIGFWVWSMRPTELSASIMAIGGACLPIMIFPAAIYSTRELALDPVLFRWLAAIDHFGALGFGASMVALFYAYPHRLVPPRALYALPAILGAWWVADTAWAVFEGPPLGFHFAALVLMFLFPPAVLLQYRKTRNNPAQRAALRWFALAVGVSTGMFVLLIIVPNLLGFQQHISQAHAFLLFIIVYSGVAIGVARYRLFELERWSFGVLFYIAGALMLVLLDTFLIFALSLDQAPALGLSLMAVALLYLPLRDTLHRRIVGRATDHGMLFQGAVDVALTPPGADQNARWATLLRQAFNPLRIDTCAPAQAVSRTVIRDEGLSLFLPGIGGVRPVVLGYAHGGRKLFSRADEKAASELCMMLDHAIRSRQSREDGIAEERARISRDIHDNLGASLLNALHSQDGAQKDSLIRETLSDLRSIITDSSAPGASLQDALASIRRETADRLAACNVQLDWPPESCESVYLSSALVHTMRSIIREAVTNVIKHARARRVTVQIAQGGDVLHLTIHDDGCGFHAAAIPSGHGLANMLRRVQAWGGDFTCTPAAGGGTCLSATLQLDKPV